MKETKGYKPIQVDQEGVQERDHESCNVPEFHKVFFFVENFTTPCNIILSLS